MIDHARVEAEVRRRYRLTSGHYALQADAFRAGVAFAQSGLSPQAYVWFHPPDDLTDLARVVEAASHVSVDVGSDADQAREWLCKIAALRFAQAILKEQTR